MELEMHKKDGSTFPALGNSMILRDKNGKFLMTRSSILDITEYTKIAEKLKNAMEVKSAFTSMVSHELRTPLASIKEGVGIVLDGSAGDINDEQKKFLELAKRNVDRLHRLINNVLDFTKFDAGKMIFNFKEEDLNKLVGELVNANEPALTKNGLYIETEFAGEMPFVILDADKISQVLSNLINNAEKFTIRGGIRVTTSYNSIRDEAVVKVIDTGQGISAEDIGKLFEKFTTVGSKRMMGSTGLGLAICKQIIQGHSGRIYAESELGKGSVFTFVLPVKGAKNA
jgi:two-component system sensor histidine kinase GlrK